MSAPRIIVALDYPHAAQARQMVARLDATRSALKVGKELFTRAGPQFVEELVAGGFRVFLDLKFHDIPNTVAGACAAARDLGVWMLNVHASGGSAMMEAARSALGDAADRPLLIAVTVLTSMDEEDLACIGVHATPSQHVVRLAALAEESQLDGVVCSAQDLVMLRQAVAPEFLAVTPGVRPEGAPASDQKRIATPAEALAAGASYLVIGRPITAAEDPMRALAAIEREIEDRLS